MGAVIVVANQGNIKAKTIDDLVDFAVGNILGQLKIKHHLQPRGGE